MNQYSVTIPITASVVVVVDAESEEAAIEAALDLQGDGFWLQLNSSEQRMSYQPEMIQWEAHRQIVQGNVFYGGQNEIEVEDCGEVDAPTP